MSSLHELLAGGFERLRNDEGQIKFRQIVADLRGTTEEVLRSVDAVLLPNDEYMAKNFSMTLMQPEYDCYNYDGTCRWSNYLILPIYNVADEIVALGGFNPFLYAKAHEVDGEGANYYQYSSSNIFKKGNYVYCPKGIQEKAMREGYIFVTDGLFDCISLVGAGFNAASLMSSNLTPEIAVQLRLVGNVIMACDNDKAGLKLRDDLNRMVRKTIEFRHGKTKDIDELLNSEFREETIKELNLLVQSLRK